MPVEVVRRSEPLKIIHLSAHAGSGGAARAMLRLHLELIQEGCDSTVLALHNERNWPHVDQVVVPQNLIGRLRRRFHRVIGCGQVRPPSGSHDSFSDERSLYRCEIRRQLPAADVTHLHWITGFVDAPHLFTYLRTPAVWTLHDMNAFTGGCHYSEGCDRFASNCGRCPQLDSTQEHDTSSAIQHRKTRIRESIAPDRLVVVAPSTWMAETARRSSVLRPFRVEVIPYGIDLEVFRPLDRLTARQQLGLPATARVLFFCADYQTPRKGFAQLLRALDDLRTLPELIVLSVGEGAPAMDLPVRHHRLGRISADDQMVRAYAAADLFVIPSLEDNLPNTVLESLACGRPVVGFAAGGIPEAVGEAGYTVPVRDAASLAAAARSLLTDEPLRTRFGLAARARAEKHYAAGLQASRYIALYARLIATCAATPTSA